MIYDPIYILNCGRRRRSVVGSPREIARLRGKFRHVGNDIETAKTRPREFIKFSLKNARRVIPESVFDRPRDHKAHRSERQPGYGCLSKDRQIVKRPPASTRCCTSRIPPSSRGILLRQWLDARRLSVFYLCRDERRLWAPSVEEVLRQAASS